MKYSTIDNMEDLKRAFFNGDYDTFEILLKECPYKYYRVGYKYNSDKDGAPDYSAKNLLKGFVRNFDDYRKYFMICFRCMKYEENNETRYKYDSLWIVNTNDDISTIIKDIYDDFEFEEDNNLEIFINDIKKIVNLDDTICIAESYVH
jgi:hypothetical protein